MAVVRKVTSKVTKETSNEKELKQGENKTSGLEASSDGKSTAVRKTATKKCYFCANNTFPAYYDAASLRRYVSDRGRIHPRSKTNLCSKHQRRLTKQIKYARHLSLLPFIVRV